MSDKPESKDEQPKLSSAFKEWMTEHLPWGLKAFVPWVRAEARHVRQGWVFFLFITALLLSVTIWATWNLCVSPLEEKLVASEKAKSETEQKLAPFWAAGDRYFSNAPSAERLAALLDALTNSAADVRALREFQNRQAKLDVLVIGEGAGWNRVGGTIFSNAIVYVPLFGGTTNAGIHLVLTNSGQLPAELIHVSLHCSTQQVCSAPQWEDQTGISRENGQSQFLSKIDAIYPNSGFVLAPIKFSIESWTLSCHVQLGINAKNTPRANLPFELFFFPSRTNIPAFVSTNRLAWREFEAK